MGFQETMDLNLRLTQMYTFIFLQILWIHVSQTIAQIYENML